jgi:cell filamentation protein
MSKTSAHSRVQWRWQERDFGFRFRSGSGRREAEYYQSNKPGEYYVVPKTQRKLTKAQADALATGSSAPTSPRVVAIPWQSYSRDWDWITTSEGLVLNYAGCMDREEINRREDEGVSRAMALVENLIQRKLPEPLTIDLICQIHSELMGAIYPFAGRWRLVGLGKGSGPQQWPYPPDGIQPLMDVFQRDVLNRSPLLSNTAQEIYAYTSEVMNELLAIHPFREGNGRTSFIVANMVLMQNNLLPLDVYVRYRDEARYIAACEEGRIRRDYHPLAALLSDWEDEAIADWEMKHG